MSNIVATQNSDKFRGIWKPNVFYRQDDMVFDGTSIWIANTDFTSGATFDEVNWFCPECDAPPLETYFIKGRDSSYFSGTDFSGQTEHMCSVLPNGYLLDLVGDNTMTWGLMVLFVPFLISTGLEMELTREFVLDVEEVGSGDTMSNVIQMGRRFTFGFVFNVDKDTVSTFTGVGGRYSLVQTTNDVIGVGLSRGSEYGDRVGAYSYDAGTVDNETSYTHSNAIDVQTGTFKLQLVRGATYWIAKVFLNGVEIISYDTTIDHLTTTSAMGFIHNGADEEDSRTVEKVTDITVQDIV